MKRLAAVAAALAGGLFPAANLIAANGVTDTEIVIGSSLPLEGSFSFVGQNTKLGMDACFKQVNDAGGIHGRKLRLVVRNDGYEPDPCVANTQKLLHQDKVFALCSYVGTPTSVKAMKIWQEARVPVVGFYTGAAALRTPINRYNIHIRASYGKETAAMINAFVQKAGAKKIALFYQNDAFGETVKASTEEALQKLNLAPAAYGRFERNTLDVETGLVAIKAAQPDAVVMVGTYAPLAKFVKLAKAAGLKKTLFYTVSFVGPEPFAKELGADGEGVYVTEVLPPYTDDSVRVAREFVEAFKKSSPGTDPNFPAFEAYVNARVLCEGLQRAGKDLTVDGLLKGIESIDSGAASIGLDVSYGPKDHEGLNEVFITHIVGGKYKTVDFKAPVGR